MRIAVIGNGNIGATLARALARAGHDVAVGVRHPETTGPPVTDVASALDGAEVVVLAVPGAAVADLVSSTAARLDGRLVVDATNHIGGSGPVNARATVAAAAPAARYVRAFNTLGWENFSQPVIDGTRADLFYSCAEPDRGVMAGLITDVGLGPVWVGADTEDIVDGVLPLWFALSRIHGRHLAFKVLSEA